MKIVAASDLHGYLPAIEPCDLLILAGDTPPWQNHEIAYQRQWFENDFLDWIKSDRCPAERIVLIAGNHDLLFEKYPPSGELGKRVIYLQDSEAEVDGLRIYGTPWSEILAPHWAFSLPEQAKRDDEPDLTKAFAAIPDGIDVLVTHMPPARFGDCLLENVGSLSAHFKRVHIGSPSLLYRVEEVKPRLHVFGHVHEDYGSWEHEGIRLANVSLLDERYEYANTPQVFEL